MFTVKLFYRKETDGALVTHVESCDHVEAREFGKGDAKAVELWVFKAPGGGGDYHSYLIGDNKAQPDRESPNFISEGWWQWGLLENSTGKTTEHYRPASYG